MWQIIEFVNLTSGIVLGSIGIISLYKETKLYNRYELRIQSHYFDK